MGTGPWFPNVSGFQKLRPVYSYHWGELHVPALGCHAIIPESTRFGGKMWLCWCEGCKPNRGAKARAQARAHKRMVDKLAKGRLSR